MTKKICSALILFTQTIVFAQQISVSEIARTAKFDKTIEEINNGPKKIRYSDIVGNPYYKEGFVPAKVGDTQTIIPIRYNAFLDTVEVMDNNTNNVYEMKKDAAFSKFTFQRTNEKLVLVNTNNELSGYFFELVSGNNRLLKKIIVNFKDEIPAPNTLIPGSPAQFELLKPIYFIKTENNIIKISKKTDNLINALPADKKDAVKNFIKTNKIKLTEEPDLIKLVNFLNN